MALIRIDREHHLGKDDAMARVEQVAGALKEELAAEYDWHGNVLRFSRPGVAGAIEVRHESLHLELKLGPLLSAMKGKIEKTIRQRLDEALGPSDTGTA
jgi:putative polyhydroxyalkanoate system protein